MFSMEVSEDIQKPSSRDFPGGPMVRILHSTEGVVSSIPGGEVRSHMTQSVAILLCVPCAPEKNVFSVVSYNTMLIWLIELFKLSCLY